MLSQVKAITACLAARSYVYKLLQRLFGDEPNIEILNMILGRHTENVIEILFDKEQTFDIITVLSNFKETLYANPESVLEYIKDEYIRLMIGPGRLLAPPWESVYLQKDDTLFNGSVIELRQIYMKYNLRAKNSPREADDHIALGLDFMSILSGLLLDCFQQQHMKEARRLFIDQRYFLEKHLFSWIPLFASRLQTADECLFYPKLARLTCRFLEADTAIMDELAALVL